MSKQQVQLKTEDGIYFFNDADVTHTKDGRSFIGSELPAWYHEKHIEIMRNDLRTIEHQLESGTYKDESGALRARQKELASKLAEIEDQRPALGDKQKDRLDKARKFLSEKISRANFSHDEVRRGFVRAETEADRMSQPCIPQPPEVAELAHVANIKMNGDRAVTRIGAEKLYQLVSRSLGEDTNIERLRRDK